jgi:hypothetical protein
MDLKGFGSATRVAAVFALGSVLTGGACFAASVPLALGSLGGSVRSTDGIPQMGAVVHLYNRYEKLISKVITNANGEFGFDALAPEVYSVRVTLASFVPALKRNIAIQPGTRSVLAINLASVLSTIELVYSAPNSGTLMSDDWKWVLRSSMTTRPVLRMIPGIDLSEPAKPSSSRTEVFSDTRGMLRVSSGEASPFASAGNQPDLGTSFALATSLFGNTQLQFSGNLGYTGSSSQPAAGFRTSFSRGDAGPEVNVTMQQVSLPLRGIPLVGSQQNTNVPALRSMSVSMVERRELTDGIHFDYGVSLDSVTFLDRLNYLSPFARLTYELGDKGKLAFGYSSGAPPLELLSMDGSDEEALAAEVMALSVLPRVSLRDGMARVQRTQNFEVAYELELGSRTVSVGFYHEAITNAALTLNSPDGAYYNGDLLPELSSSSYVFNIGDYNRHGYSVSLTQNLGERYSATVAYGSGGALVNDGSVLETADPNELRRSISRKQRHWVRWRLAGVAPVSGTRFVTSYEWTDYSAMTPGHVYLTQSMLPETGLNLRLRQPLPCWGVLPGRIEATAEMRNMLAQGYMPVSFSDGRRLVLAQSPRTVRGGVSFIF